MAYILEVSFDIGPDQMDALRIGASLERILGYLRTLLPSETGYITARAFYSLENDDSTHVVFMSEWQDWEDLDRHRQSSILENKVLREFQPHLGVHLSSRIYSEVA